MENELLEERIFQHVNGAILEIGGAFDKNLARRVAKIPRWFYDGEQD